ncbi:MAG TPA: histidinol-phosphate transaminase [Gammaproteobacteria bacterium]|nr:histidinol-phosphate transaminase [Gammaproteobacteria bacterium]
MSDLWSAFVRALTPYVPGEQPRDPDVIKLNTNENPYGPSPKVLSAIRAEVNDALRLYPDPNTSQLKSILAEVHSISPDQVFVGNGSDEVLAHIFHGLLQHDEPVLFPDIAYSFYPVYCRLYDIAYETIPLDVKFGINFDAYNRPNGGIIFSNPNAPTGRGLKLDSIEELLAHNSDSVVIVDEAYVAFGGESAIGLTEKFKNLLVVQTLSKSHGLAGLRVGFAFGHPTLIEALERVKNSFNSYPLDRLAIAGAVAAIQDPEYLDKTCKQVVATRKRLVSELERLKFEVLPSQANFVFVTHLRNAAEDISHALRDRSIFVRHFDQARIADYLRITVGKDDEINALINALQEILAETEQRDLGK